MNLPLQVAIATTIPYYVLYNLNLYICFTLSYSQSAFKIIKTEGVGVHAFNSKNNEYHSMHPNINYYHVLALIIIIIIKNYAGPAPLVPLRSTTVNV